MSRSHRSKGKPSAEPFKIKRIQTTEPPAQVGAVSNSSSPGGGRENLRPLVSEEEAIIVGVVLLLWVAVLLLFFKKWGKIRMLEPYHPEYSGGTLCTSKGSGRAPGLPQGISQDEKGCPLPGDRPYRRLSDLALPLLPRPRLNSMFVCSPYQERGGSLLSLLQENCSRRKTRSAEDVSLQLVFPAMLPPLPKRGGQHWI